MWFGSEMVGSLNSSSNAVFQIPAIPLSANKTTLDKLFTHVPLSPSSIIWFLVKAQWRPVPWKVTVSLALHWPCVVTLKWWTNNFTWFGLPLTHTLLLCLCFRLVVQIGRGSLLQWHGCCLWEQATHCGAGTDAGESHARKREIIGSGRKTWHAGYWLAFFSAL